MNTRAVFGAADVLFAIAEGHQGYFTSKQAADAGYQPRSQANHVKSGNWVRVERGIYRLARFPQSSKQQLVIYALWKRNREGEPERVFRMGNLSARSQRKFSAVVPGTACREFQIRPPRKYASVTAFRVA